MSAAAYSSDPREETEHLFPPPPSSLVLETQRAEAMSTFLAPLLQQVVRPLLAEISHTRSELVARAEDVGRLRAELAGARAATLTRDGASNQPEVHHLEARTAEREAAVTRLTRETERLTEELDQARRDAAARSHASAGSESFESDVEGESLEDVLKAKDAHIASLQGLLDQQQAATSRIRDAMQRVEARAQVAEAALQAVMEQTSPGPRDDEPTVPDDDGATTMLTYERYQAEESRRALELLQAPAPAPAPAALAAEPVVEPPPARQPARSRAWWRRLMG